MNRFVQAISKDTRRDPSVISPIAVAQNTKAIVALPDITKSPNEYVYRAIENVGVGNLYVGIGFQPDTTVYSFILAPDVLTTGITHIEEIKSADPIYVYSSASGGGTVACYQLIRYDNIQQGNIITANAP